MSENKMLFAVLALAAIGGLVYATTRDHPAESSVASSTEQRLSGAVDAGAAERSAWAGLTTAVINATGQIAGAVSRPTNQQQNSGGYPNVSDKSVAK